jgi:hypothetical protein
VDYLDLLKLDVFKQLDFALFLIFFSSVEVEENLNRDLRGDQSAAADARFLGSAR